MINPIHHVMTLKRSWLLLLLLPTPCFANFYYDRYHYPYLSGSIAGSAGEIGSGNPAITYDNGTITDAYPPTSRSSTRALLSLSGGLEFMGKPDSPTFDLGLGVYATPTYFQYNGNMIETATGGPSTSLFSYSYKVNSTRLMAEAQMNWMLGDFVPFVNGGIGIVWNSTKSYDEAPIAGTTYTPLPGFQNKTTTNLAYQLGIGLSYLFFAGVDSNKYEYKGQSYQDDFRKERISIGYRYANLGPASFGTRDASYPYPLNIGSLTTNDIYLSYTHFF